MADYTHIQATARERPATVLQRPPLLDHHIIHIISKSMADLDPHLDLLAHLLVHAHH